MLKHTSTILFAGLLFLFLNCFAEEEALDTSRVYRLKEVVITATRSGKDLRDIGRSVTLLTREQLDNALVSDVSNVLTRQQGMYVVGAGQNPGMVQSIFMRGTNTNHMAILVDDVRISDPSGVNNALDLSELSLVGLERVEIVRGSHSTLYGSSAIGGVVNLITRKQNNPGFNGHADVTAGTFGRGSFAFSQNLFLNFSSDNGWYVNGAVFNSKVNGLDATIDTVRNQHPLPPRDRDRFAHLDLIGKIGYTDERWDVYGSYKRTNQKTDIDETAYMDDDNYTIDFHRDLFTYGASYRVYENLSLKFVGGYSAMGRSATDDSSAIDLQGNTDQTYAHNRWRGTTWTNEIQTNFAADGFEAVIGAGLYREAMGIKTYFYSGAFGGFESGSDLDTLNLHASTRSIFVHLDIRGSLIEPEFAWLSCALGGRWYHHSTFGNRFTSVVNPSIRLSNSSLLYGSYSAGFNAPSLYQLYTPEKDFISGITRGNSNLQPEISSSFEIGIKHDLDSRWSFGINYFHTIVDNVIEYIYLWDGASAVDTLDFADFRGDTYLNLGTLTSRGIELTVRAQLNDWLWIDGNFSMVSGKLRYVPSDVDAAHTQGNHVQIFNSGTFVDRGVEISGLVRRPNVANISLLYKPLDEFFLRVDVRHVGERRDIYYSSALGPFGALGTMPVADYTLVDVSQRYKFDKHFSLAAKVENIFDTRYVEINGFTTRGRGLYLKAQYSL